MFLKNKVCKLNLSAASRVDLDNKSLKLDRIKKSVLDMFKLTSSTDFIF